jgi:hypothetical protein
MVKLGLEFFSPSLGRGYNTKKKGSKMPKAFVQRDETTHFDLESCPDGYVKLRKFTYGEHIKHNQMTSSMRMKANQDNSFDAEMDLTSFDAVQYQLSKCVVEHNLEKDDNGNLFDFSRAADIEILDPKIGGEIQQYISKMNEFTADLSNSDNQGKSEQQSLDTKTQTRAG